MAKLLTFERDTHKISFIPPLTLVSFSSASLRFGSILFNSVQLGSVRLDGVSKRALKGLNGPDEIANTHTHTHGAKR